MKEKKAKETKERKARIGQKKKTNRWVQSAKGCFQNTL